jgi:choline dehydrogenase-like flavoprotein
MDRSNLTVLAGTFVTQVLFAAGRSTGVEVIRDDNAKYFQAGSEVTICASISISVTFPQSD